MVITQEGDWGDWEIFVVAADSREDTEAIVLEKFDNDVDIEQVIPVEVLTRKTEQENAGK